MLVERYVDIPEIRYNNQNETGDISCRACKFLTVCGRKDNIDREHTCKEWIDADYVPTAPLEYIKSCGNCVKMEYRAGKYYDKIMYCPVYDVIVGRNNICDKYSAIPNKEA